MSYIKPLLSIGVLALAIALGAGCSVPQPVPGSAPLPTSEAVATASAEDTRRTEEEGRTGIIIETSRKDQVAKPVEEPTPAEPEVTDELRVHIQDDDGVLLNGEPVADPEALRAAFREAAERDQRRVHISAEKSVPYQRLLTILDAALESGLTEFSIESVEESP